MGIFKLFRNIAGYTEIYLAFGVGIIIFMMMMPVSAFMLDILLTLSLSISLIILMSAILIVSPMDITSFPTILLISTILRLSLNLASTRLILSNGHKGSNAAGDVINAFANFLVGGNMIIGVIVFTIIIIINFLVITKGASRIAEVSARFILDAIPGKQMAIDADLSAGLIDEKQASARRKDVERESNFYGAMDGASKFVKGDVIAGLIITLVNIIGGIAIGILQKNITILEALQSYSMLTIGDGLVSQIPALVISISAGLIISKISSEGSANTAIANEIIKNRLALIIVAIIMVLMSLLPGIPIIPFVSMSAILLYAYYKLEQYSNKLHDNQIDDITTTVEDEEDEIYRNIRIKRIKIELGYNILGIMHAGEDQNFASKKINQIRKKIFDEKGIIIPEVYLSDNIALPSNEYLIKIKEIVVAKGDIKPDMVLCINPSNDNEVNLPGEDTIDPAFGIKAKWIYYTSISQAKEYGYTIIEPHAVILTHLSEIIHTNITDIFTIVDMQDIIAKNGEEAEKIMNDISPSKITVYDIHAVFLGLLSEFISIRDILSILSSIAVIVNQSAENTIDNIVEFVRYNIRKQITSAITSGSNKIHGITLTDELEDKLFQDISNNTPDKADISNIINTISDISNKMDAIPCIITGYKIRKTVKQFIQNRFPFMHVISSREIDNNIEVNIVGVIK